MRQSKAAMSDPNSSDSIRRLRRADRKKAIQARGPLFPPDDDLRFAPPEVRAAAEQAAPEAEPTVPDDGLTAPASELESVPRSESQPAPVKTHRGGCLPNLVAFGFVLATLASIGVFTLIALNPYSSINPFPPFTPLPIIITATFLPPTATLPATAGPTATFTPLAVEPAASEAAFAFSLVGGVLYQANANPEGCNWSSIAGSVTAADNSALDGYRVKVTGAGVDDTVFSGTTAAFGPGGFELFLNGTPQAAVYTVQLFDLQGEAVSAPVEVSTRAECAESVALLNFRAG